MEECWNARDAKGTKSLVGLKERDPPGGHSHHPTSEYMAGSCFCCVRSSTLRRCTRVRYGTMLLSWGKEVRAGERVWRSKRQPSKTEGYGRKALGCGGRHERGLSVRACLCVCVLYEESDV